MEMLSEMNILREKNAMLESTIRMYTEKWERTDKMLNFCYFISKSVADKGIVPTFKNNYPSNK